MDKKWYNYFVSFEGNQPEGAAEPASGKKAAPPASAAQTVADIAASIKVEPKFAASMANSASFEEIYKAAEIHPPAHGFTIFKIADMLRSERIRNLPLDVKRSSVLLALDTAAVKLQDIIGDAVRRDKALDAFEAVQQRALEQFETQKKAENESIQAEMDRLLKQHQAKIEVNNESVAKQKDQFQKWCTQKRQEEQRIADAVTPFVSENPISVGAGRKAP